MDVQIDVFYSHHGNFVDSARLCEYLAAGRCAFRLRWESVDDETGDVEWRVR